MEALTDGTRSEQCHSLGSTSGARLKYHTKYCAVTTCTPMFIAGQRSAPPSVLRAASPLSQLHPTLFSATKASVCSRKALGRCAACCHPSDATARS